MKKENQLVKYAVFGEYHFTPDEDFSEAYDNYETALEKAKWSAANKAGVKYIVAKAISMVEAKRPDVDYTVTEIN